MSAKWIVIAMAVAGWLVLADGARAQLFGNRTVGQGISPPRSRESGAGQRSLVGQLLGRQSSGSGSTGSGSSGNSRSAFAGVGMPDASARYMRGNRQATDFVGTDSRDSGGFVGRQQAEGDGQIRSAIDDLRVQSGPDANRTQAASARQRTRMYEPRLRVNFDFTRGPTAEINSRLTHRLESSLTLAGTARVEVSVEGGTATLRGEVGSERNRKLARLILLLEPGISNVRDELIVKRPQPTPQASRSTPPTARPGSQP